tara:strand:+ start:1202 stop:1369 length:168 start_codon:yes stop_codon:yes gene_type:complete
MSKISKEGLEQVQIIKNALDSMYDKLEKSGYFDKVQPEFESIAEIVANTSSWEEV